MLETFYCQACGSLMRETQLPSELRPRLVCDACGYIHYFNPKVVTGTLPVEDGKVWLLRRGIEPRYGYWTYPAGFQELDETTEEGALRETMEELGCAVEITRLQGVYSRPFAPVNVVYLARLVPGGERPHETDEGIEVRAFAPAELPWHELAFPSTHLVLRDWANGKSL